jgi:uncharacterized protein DUF1553/uncharacterized protein DUF1549
VTVGFLVLAVHTAFATNHWAFVPPVRPPIPGPGNPIDAFIRARLQKENIKPSPEADRATLIRRLSFDLTGLPPTVQEVDAFIGDPSGNAYENLVDRLLSSPHFGEQWARHWLDLARYADSDGYEKDGIRPNAYFYRDWVIRAINTDMPFDQFTIQQLAGDLLPNPTIEQKKATAFHRQTLTNKEGGVDQEEDRCKATTDRVNTTASVWLGLTVGCAECHNHKYDPISQHEYYQLYAFFNNASEFELVSADEQISTDFIGPPRPIRIATVVKADPPRKTHVHERGDFLRKGEEVEPGTLKVLHAFKPRAEEPDRLDLARWLMARENPVTARVTVNHMWQHLFGRGLVNTPADFGTRGERPSHPELLDWLATEFPRLNWSRKAMIKLTVMSQTYRQSSRYRSELAERDPQNILLARQNRLRLPAENVRDAHLVVSGLLTRKIGGPSVRPPMPADIAAIGYADSVKWKESQGEDRYRRGLYTFFQRTVPYPMLMTFDAPDSNTTCTRRERSNTPLQALTLLNDSTFFECAQTLGQRLAPDNRSREQTIARAFKTCLAREPRPEELARLEQFLEKQPPTMAGVALARTIMNLDEFVTRE